MNFLSKKKLPKIALLLGILFLVLLHFYVPRTITEIKHPVVSFFKSDHLKTHQRNFSTNPIVGRVISFVSFDNKSMTAYLRYAQGEEAKGTVILLHGIRSSKEHFADICGALTQRGYNAVAVDLRAHGASDGTHCTFGIKEKKDISQLITVLQEEEGIDDNIGIWGQSLGGAVALQTLAIDKRLRFGIIESTFARLESTTHDYSSFHLGFDLKPLTNYLLNRAGKIAGFDPASAAPVLVCPKVTQPMIVVHGDQDQRIGIKYGRENFEQLASADKKFITIEGANHLTTWDTGGDAYFDQIFRFIKQQEG